MFQRIILALLLAASCFAQDKISNESVTRMEQIVQSYVPGKFMGTVLVAQDGKILLDKGYGFANLEWDVPNTPTTKFRLGSITSSSPPRQFCCWRSAAS
jgi:CubicO group peptidase (beta-lactamase class C family)